MRARVVVARRQPQRVSRADGAADRVRESRHLHRTRLVQDGPDRHRSPRRVRREERAAAHVADVERDPSAVQVAAGRDEAAALRHAEVGRARDRRAGPACSGNVEDRIRAAVLDVEPHGLDGRQRLTRDVADGVPDLDDHRVRMVVHQHVQQAPGVMTAVGIAVAARQGEREVLLAFRVKALCPQ